MKLKEISINNKNTIITHNGEQYARIPIKTDVIYSGDYLFNVIPEAINKAGVEVDDYDYIFVAESIVAITQHRVWRLEEIKPRWLANFLSKKVSRNPGGIGLTCPEMMEMAIQEVGVLRILIASAASVIGKILGKKGWFYIVAGPKVRGIDGPDEYKLPPYNKTIVLAPREPQVAAENIAHNSGYKNLAIVDINDLGQNVLGNYGHLSDEDLASILRDNPLGQSDEQTPFGIIKKIK